MRRWPLARAVAGSGGCLLVAFVAFFAALFVLGHGVGASVEQRRSRRQVTL